MRQTLISDDGAWLGPFSQAISRQFERKDCRRFKPWHILVHEQLFKQTSQRKMINKDVQTQNINKRSNEDDQTQLKLYSRHSVSGANR